MSQDNLVLGQDLDTLTINYDMNQRYDTQENLKKRKRKGKNGHYEMSQKQLNEEIDHINDIELKSTMWKVLRSKKA